MSILCGASRRDGGGARPPAAVWWLQESSTAIRINRSCLWRSIHTMHARSCAYRQDLSCSIRGRKLLKLSPFCYYCNVVIFISSTWAAQTQLRWNINEIDLFECGRLGTKWAQFRRFPKNGVLLLFCRLSLSIVFHSFFFSQAINEVSHC